MDDNAWQDGHHTQIWIGNRPVTQEDCVCCCFAVQRKWLCHRLKGILEVSSISQVKRDCPIFFHTPLQPGAMEQQNSQGSY